MSNELILLLVLLFIVLVFVITANTKHSLLIFSLITNFIAMAGFIMTYRRTLEKDLKREENGEIKLPSWKHKLAETFIGEIKPVKNNENLTSGGHNVNSNIHADRDLQGGNTCNSCYSATPYKNYNNEYDGEHPKDLNDRISNLITEKVSNYLYNNSDNKFKTMNYGLREAGIENMQGNNLKNVSNKKTLGSPGKEGFCEPIRYDNNEALFSSITSKNRDIPINQKAAEMYKERGLRQRRQAVGMNASRVKYIKNRFDLYPQGNKERDWWDEPNNIKW